MEKQIIFHIKKPKKVQAQTKELSKSVSQPLKIIFNENIPEVKEIPKKIRLFHVKIENLFRIKANSELQSINSPLPLDSIFDNSKDTKIIPKYSLYQRESSRYPNSMTARYPYMAESTPIVKSPINSMELVDFKAKVMPENSNPPRKQPYSLSQLTTKRRTPTAPFPNLKSKNKSALNSSKSIVKMDNSLNYFIPKPPQFIPMVVPIIHQQKPESAIIKTKKYGAPVTKKKRELRSIIDIQPKIVGTTISELFGMKINNPEGKFQLEFDSQIGVE